MARIQQLSKAEIREYDGDHLYVLNTSDLNGSTSRTELLMTFNLSGNSQTIEIASTWIPIDLTSRVSIAQIKDNRDFWHFINHKALAVISPEVAEEVLDTEDAQEEYNRIHDIKMGKDGNDEEDTHIEHDMDDRMSQAVRDRVGPLAKGNLRRQEGSAKVIAIMSKDMSESLKLAALKNIQAELKADDLRYVLKNAKNGDQERIKQWAGHKLADK